MSNYMAIKTMDINNGPGLRISVWLSGCEFKCSGCHNKEAWDFKAGKEFTNETVSSVLSLLNDEDLNLSILGGEPLHENNIGAVYELVKRTKEVYPNKTIWLWTGFTMEVLSSRNDIHKKSNDYRLDYILNNIDTIIDGTFVQELHSEDLKYKGSSNQRIFNLGSGSL